MVTIYKAKVGTCVVCGVSTNPDTILCEQHNGMRMNNFAAVMELDGKRVMHIRNGYWAFCFKDALPENGLIYITKAMFDEFEEELEPYPGRPS